MNHEFRSTPSGEKSIKGIPQRRVGAESDLDGAIMLRASSASCYMTGSVVTVDGGILADATINSIRARIALHVIASEAKQSSFVEASWIASCLRPSQ